MLFVIAIFMKFILIKKSVPHKTLNIRYIFDVQSENPSGVTALHSTCLKGHVEAALLLVQSGAMVTHKDHKCMTAIHYAAKSEDGEVGHCYAFRYKVESYTLFY